MASFHLVVLSITMNRCVNPLEAGRWANQVHVHVAETSGRYRDVLGPHMDVSKNLTLLTGKARSGHGGHV